MAAPQIPNLLSLRGRGRGRVRGRGPSSGTPGFEPEHETLEQAQARADRIVPLTDHDANLSRLSAVDAGYLRDPFAHAFAPITTISRRMPIINRGTYARTVGIDQLVQSFVSSHPGSKQILSLGAGTDTRYFKLASAGLLEGLVYHEVDFPENNTAKLDLINRSKDLRELMTDISAADETSMHSKHYHLHAFDLRKLADDSSAEAPFLSGPSSSATGLANDVPTLILSECCLCYLTVKQVDGIIGKLVSTDTTAGYLKGSVGLVFYEPIEPNDAFGRVMVHNLKQRGIRMPTLSALPTLKDQKNRFGRHGLTDGAKAVDMGFVMARWVTEDERERVDSCEMLDEVEEWNLLAQHYCISFGWRHIPDASSNTISQPWSVWRGIPAQAS